MMRCKPLPLRPKGGMLLLAALVLLLVAVLDPSSSAGQGAASAPADKTELLQRKLAAMEELRGRIGLKLIEASGLRDSLTSRIVPLELELQTLAAQHHCSTFAQTAEHPQILAGFFRRVANSCNDIDTVLPGKDANNLAPQNTGTPYNSLVICHVLSPFCMETISSSNDN